MSDQEIEIKFYVTDFSKIKGLLAALGARLTQPRIFEANLRFDTPSGSLSEAFQILRLRQDTAARLTYKGPTEIVDGVRTRQEIEVIVEDFQKARTLLEALGYQVTMLYEKYRAVYDLFGVAVMLDEMPYGLFVELEGPNKEALYLVNQKLGLDWDAGIPLNYTALFERLKEKMRLPFFNLTFDNFEGLSITGDDLGVRPADRHPTS